MKQEEAKRKIIELWLQRPKSKRTSPNVLIFYFHLQKKYSSLLKFRTTDPDKYQVVKSFLLDYTDDKP